MGCPVSTGTVAEQGNESFARELSPLPEYSDKNSKDGDSSSNPPSRRASIDGARDEAFVEPSLFFYDDFQVPARPSPKKCKSGSHMRPSHSGSDVFQFGDFSVSIVDEIGIAQWAGDCDETSLQRKLSRRLLSPKPQFKCIRKADVTTRLGHGARVKCIAIAPNEKEYVSCSNEETRVTLYDLRTGKERGFFDGHQDTVINATYSYDGKFLATTSRDRTMILWDVVTTKQILTFEHSKVVICCCFSKDSKYVATGCQDRVCRVWDTRRGREMLIFAQHDGIIISMSFSPDGAFCASASADRTIRVWSTVNGKLWHILQGHMGIVLSCMYFYDGRKILSNDEKLVRIWNTNDGSCSMSLNVDTWVKTPVGRLTWTLSCTAPGDFSKFIVVACNNRFVYVIDTEKGEEQFYFQCRSPAYCLTVGHEKYVAFGDSYGNVYMLEMV